MIFYNTKNTDYLILYSLASVVGVFINMCYPFWLKLGCVHFRLAIKRQPNKNLILMRFEKKIEIAKKYFFCLAKKLPSFPFLGYK